ncbi:hypothetical protein E1301_Tti011895 [Triplophysa tibetana]|uniref:Uncharacterized protein n=1 Tax=Triplophysa tibetana TaxID=1572043 RepID=A0A5A9PK67_9TELE|nr:hypothetical protein E1301_Tti011895 [Triplophysa tibetana]
MDRLGTQKSGSRSMEICFTYKSLNLEQIRSLSEQFSNGRFEGTVLLRASCDTEGKSFHQAPRNESKATGRKVADSELNSPASRMNENRLMNAVKRTAHFSPLLTSTSAGGTDSGLSGLQSSLTKGKVKGIIDRQGNIKNAMMRRARCGMWGWIFALVFFWNTHMLRAQDGLLIWYDKLLQALNKNSSPPAQNYTQTPFRSALQDIPHPTHNLLPCYMHWHAQTHTANTKQLA